MIRGKDGETKHKRCGGCKQQREGEWGTGVLKRSENERVHWIHRAPRIWEGPEGVGLEAVSEKGSGERGRRGETGVTLVRIAKGSWGGGGLQQKRSVVVQAPII